MKRIFKSIFAAASALLLMTGCTGNFEEMNVDPSSPSAGKVDPQFQFLYVLNANVRYQACEQITVATFCQYDANSTQTCGDYNVLGDDIKEVWSTSYYKIVNLNSLISNYKDDEVNCNVAYMSMIWKVWIGLRLTNVFGDCPYSEAGTGSGENPKYDKQEEIYKLMFEELTEGVNGLAANKQKKTVGAYDIIYGGNIDKWIKFGNSLRLRMAVRILNVNKTLAAQEAKKAVTAAGGLMSSHDDGAFRASGDETNASSSRNAMYEGRNSSHSVLHMSLSYYKLVNNLGGVAWPTAADQAANANITDAIVGVTRFQDPTTLEWSRPEKVDPRSPIHWEPVGQRGGVGGGHENWWRGSEPGHSNRATLSGEMDNGDNATNYCSVGPFYYTKSSKPWALFKHAELELLKAIALEKGLITSSDLGGQTAKDCYEAAIRSDMSEYGVPSNVVDAYLADETPNDYGTTVNYTHTAGTCNTPMDKILTQKYIAQFMECSWETWADHRQFHKPTLIPPHTVANSFVRTQADIDNNTPNTYLKRVVYPNTETTTNAENLQEAINRLGGKDDMQKNMWWDVD